MLMSKVYRFQHFANAMCHSQNRARAMPFVGLLYDHALCLRKATIASNRIVNPATYTIPMYGRFGILWELSVIPWTATRKHRMRV